MCNIPFVLPSEHPLMYTTPACGEGWARVERGWFEDTRRRARMYLGRREGAPAATTRIVIVQFAKTKAHPVSSVREAPLDISRGITQSA